MMQVWRQVALTSWCLTIYEILWVVTDSIVTRLRFRSREPEKVIG